MARIVVADNDPDARDLLLLDLRLEGHEVTDAYDGDSARDLVRSFAPDVVVLDHWMPPGPTGLLVGIGLRAEQPHLRVAVYSNYCGAELVRRTGEHGIFFLPKGNLRTLRAWIAGSLATS